MNRHRAVQRTLYLFNTSDKDVVADISFAGLVKPLMLKQYQVTEAVVSKPGFKLTPQAAHSITEKNLSLQIRLPSKSNTAYTTYDLSDDSDGIIHD